jgi:hypothetical protein
MIKLIAKSKELNAELEKLYNQVNAEMDEARDIVEKHLGVRPIGLSITNVFGYDFIIKASSFSFDKEIDSPHLKFQSKNNDGTITYKLLKSHKEGRKINKEFEKFRGIGEETLKPFGVHTWNGRQYGGFGIGKNDDGNYFLNLSNSCFDVIELVSKHYEIETGVKAD